MGPFPVHSRKKHRQEFLYPCKPKPGLHGAPTCATEPNPKSTGRSFSTHASQNRACTGPYLCHRTKPKLETKTVNPKTSHKLTKTEIITTIKSLAKKLGRIPTNNEVEGMTPLRRR